MAGNHRGDLQVSRLFEENPQLLRVMEGRQSASNNFEKNRKLRGALKALRNYSDLPLVQTDSRTGDFELYSKPQETQRNVDVKRKEFEMDLDNGETRDFLRMSY